MKKLHGLIATMALTTTTLLSAQTTDNSAPSGPRHGGPHGPGARGGHPIVRALDADKNGEISAAEIDRAPAALAALDKNGDSKVTVDELRPARPSRPEGAPPPADAPVHRVDRVHRADHPRAVDPFMLALDADTDGALSASEVGNAVASLKALDVNSDGKLTRDELRPLPSADK
jgi:hypothetical protein